ncbi:uridine kinase family protein [Nakamurella leprariae]|uniref:uridine kinase family protein n=1 Tax=Nakamurella leprariae TaxID=2803911 RepID=UPI001F281583|nr:hypothetical protein [Nakamurella leprariae]
MDLEPGEPAAGRWRVIPVTELVESLYAAAGPVTGRPRIVAVDGRGGAGKTRIVDRLQVVAPSSAVVHTDDIAWHHSFFDWDELLAEHVLRPVRRGEAVDHRPRAWIDRDRPGSIAVPAGLDTVFVEGTGIVRRSLAPLLDASVWIQVDRRVAARRLLARDGDDPAHRQMVADWEAVERPFLLAERPWAHATVVVAGSPVSDGSAPDELAVADPVSSRS